MVVLRNRFQPIIKHLRVSCPSPTVVNWMSSCPWNFLSFISLPSLFWRNQDVAQSSNISYSNGTSGGVFSYQDLKRWGWFLCYLKSVHSRDGGTLWEWEHFLDLYVKIDDFIKMHITSILVPVQVCMCRDGLPALSLSPDFRCSLRF